VLCRCVCLGKAGRLFCPRLRSFSVLPPAGKGHGKARRTEASRPRHRGEGETPPRRPQGHRPLLEAGRAADRNPAPPSPLRVCAGPEPAPSAPTAPNPAAGPHPHSPFSRRATVPRPDRPAPRRRDPARPPSRAGAGSAEPPLTWKSMPSCRPRWLSAHAWAGGAAQPR